MAPATDHAVLLVFGEAPGPQARFEVVERRPTGYLDDHVDILGRSDRRCCGVRDPQHDGRAADEDDFVHEAAEHGHGCFEEVDAHATAEAEASLRLRCPIARPRMRSPIRIASTRARSSASLRSRLRRAAAPSDAAGERNAAPAAEWVRPDRWEVVVRGELVDERCGGLSRRDAARLAVELGREEVLDGMDQKLLGLRQIRPPAREGRRDRLPSSAAASGARSRAESKLDPE